MALKFVKILFFAIFFFGSLLYFLPKKNLYYYGEQELKRYHGVIGNEYVTQHPFSLQIEHGDIFVEGIRVAKVMDTSIGVYLLYNSLQAKQIRLSGMAKNFIPTKIDSLEITYTLWDPLRVKLASTGEFGTSWGYFDIRKQKLVLELNASKKMQTQYFKILSKMKKRKDGGYRYEQSF